MQVDLDQHEPMSQLPQGGDLPGPFVIEITSIPSVYSAGIA